MRKIQPSDRLRKGIQAFFENLGSAEDGAQALSEFVRLASALMVQEGLEAEPGWCRSRHLENLRTFLE